MEKECRRVLTAALALPEADRTAIVEALLRSLLLEGNDRDGDEFATELDRRLDEALRDPTAMISWSELKTMCR